MARAGLTACEGARVRVGASFFGAVIGRGAVRGAPGRGNARRESRRDSGTAHTRPPTLTRTERRTPDNSCAYAPGDTTLRL